MCRARLRREYLSNENSKCSPLFPVTGKKFLEFRYFLSLPPLYLDYSQEIATNNGSNKNS